MGRIQASTGLVTGLPIEQTVDQLMAISARPRDRLLRRNQALEAQQMAIAELTAAVIGIQLSSDRLRLPTNFSQADVASSRSSVLTGRSTGQPIQGTYQLQSLRLATASAFTSSPLASDSAPLSAGRVVIHSGGFLDSTLDLQQLNGGQGVPSGRIEISDRAGGSAIIDLRFASNLSEVVERINAASGVRVIASIEGDRLRLSDTSGSAAGRLQVREVAGGSTAAGLGLSGIDVAENSAVGQSLALLVRGTEIAGLRDGRGLPLSASSQLTVNLRDGSQVSVGFSEGPLPLTVGQLLDRINSQGDGKVEARLTADQLGLELVDKTAGREVFSLAGSSQNLVRALGWDVPTNRGGSLVGTRLASAVQGALLSTLGGGQGLGELGILQLTNRGGSTTQVDLSAAVTVHDVIEAINAAGAGISASLNATRTGIRLTDTSGGQAGPLSAASPDGLNTAVKLGLGGEATGAQLNGEGLGRQYVTESTRLETLNQGRGVRLGSIRFRDSAGQQTAINFSSQQAKTIGDVIRLINARTDIGIEARLNSSGDGLMLIDTAGGEGQLQVLDLPGNFMAADLGLAGPSGPIELDGQIVQGVVSRETIALEVAEGTTVSQLVERLQADQQRATVSLMRLGNGQVRLLANARQSGQAGRIEVDMSSLGLSLMRTTQAQDALLAVGVSENAAGVLVNSSDNRFRDVLPGLEIELKSVDAAPVSLTVTPTTTRFTDNVQQFVDQFNKVVDQLKTQTRFDPQSGESGLLFGSGEALRIELSLSRLVSERSGLGGPIRSLEQLGMRIGESGRLELDSQRLLDQYDRNPEAVEKFFTDEERGFSARSKKILDQLAGEGNSLLLSRNQSLQDRIELNSQRIDQLGVRLERERERLLKQFFTMESTIARLQSNLQGLGQLQAIPPLRRRSE